MNLPNKITTVRIALIPAMVAFYLLPFAWSKLVAALVFIVAACTDFIDGYIARSRNLVTDLGKFLDPIADKCLLLAAVILLIADGTIVAPYAQIVAIIILGRELIISAFRQIAATKNVVMAADKWGKLKTVFQDVCLAAFMFLAYLHNGLNFSISGPVYVLAVISYALLVVATVLTIVSAINYIIKNKKVFVNESVDAAENIDTNFAVENKEEEQLVNEEVESKEAVEGVEKTEDENKN